jgi:hypothetical protein
MPTDPTPAVDTANNFMQALYVQTKKWNEDFDARIAAGARATKEREAQFVHCTSLAEVQKRLIILWKEKAGVVAKAAEPFNRLEAALQMQCEALGGHQWQGPWGLMDLPPNVKRLMEKCAACGLSKREYEDAPRRPTSL